MAATIRPSQQHSCSFDDLVGAGEHGGRHFEPEHLRCLEIDHRLVFGRRLHWKIGWLLAPEDAVDVLGRAAELVDKIGPIGDQAALGANPRSK